MSKTLELASKIKQFIFEDIWSDKYENKAIYKLFLLKQLRIVMLAYKGFNEDKCLHKASALTYYSLLSIVPIFAMFFGIAKGFGYEKDLEVQLQVQFADKKDLIDQVIEFANSMLNNTKGGLIAGIGAVMLLWSVLKVLGNIELSFNEIWDLKKQRTPVRKLTDYLTIMLIAPILLVLSRSSIYYISEFVATKAETIEVFSKIGGLISFGMKLIPHSIMWFVFTFLYMIIPNTKVKFQPAFLAGVIAGILFQLLQWGYVEFQVGVARYNAIYGSFAALPLFLIWMHTSWIIVLLGGEICFAKQNVNKYEFEMNISNISESYRQKLSIYVLHYIVKMFAKGEKAPITRTIASELSIPSRLVHKICYDLSEAKLINEVRTEAENESAYQPAKDISGYTIRYVIQQLEDNGSNDYKVQETKELEKISNTLQAFYTITTNSKENLKLTDI